MKSGVITATGSESSLNNKVAITSLTILTLGALALQAFDNDEEGVPRIMLVDFGRRKIGSKVSVSGDYAALATAINADTNIALGGGFGNVDLVVADASEVSTTFDAQNASVSLLPALTPSTQLGADMRAVFAGFGVQESPKNAGSIIGTIEDGLAGVNGTTGTLSGVLMIDQLTSQTTFFPTLDTPAVDFTAGITSHVTTSVFSQDVAAAAARGLYSR